MQSCSLSQNQIEYWASNLHKFWGKLLQYVYQHLFPWFWFRQQSPNHQFRKQSFWLLSWIKNSKSSLIWWLTIVKQETFALAWLPALPAHNLLLINLCSCPIHDLWKLQHDIICERLDKRTWLTNTTLLANDSLALLQNNNFFS